MKRIARLAVLSLSVLTLLCAEAVLATEDMELKILPHTQEMWSILQTVDGKDLRVVIQPELGNFEALKDKATFTVEGGQWSDIVIWEQPLTADVFSSGGGDLHAVGYGLMPWPGSANGNYRVDFLFEDNRLAEVNTILIAAELRKHNLHQTCYLEYSLDGETWHHLGTVDTDWTWVAVSRQVFDPDTNKVWIRWSFSKPGDTYIWVTGFANLIIIGYNW